MKCLIAYYSLSGTTEKLAAALAAYLEEKGHFTAVEAIQPKKGYSRLSAYSIGCVQAIGKAKIELMPMRNELAKFDTIAVLSPTWAATCAPPAYAFASSLPNARKGQRAIVITAHGGMPGDGAICLKKELSSKGYDVFACFAVGAAEKFDEKAFEGKIKV